MCPQPGADEQKAKGPGRYLYLGTLGDSIPKLFVKKRMLIILFLFLSHVTSSLRKAGGLGSCEELEQVLVISPLVLILNSEAPKQDGPAGRSQVPSRVSR